MTKHEPLTVDLILALSEDELKARYGTNALLEAIEGATSRLFLASEGLAAVHDDFIPA